MKCIGNFVMSILCGEAWFQIQSVLGFLAYAEYSFDLHNVDDFIYFCVWRELKIQIQNDGKSNGLQYCCHDLKCILDNGLMTFHIFCQVQASCPLRDFDFIVTRALILLLFFIFLLSQFIWLFFVTGSLTYFLNACLSIFSVFQVCTCWCVVF